MYQKRHQSGILLKKVDWRENIWQVFSKWHSESEMFWVYWVLIQIQPDMHQQNVFTDSTSHDEHFVSTFDRKLTQKLPIITNYRTIGVNESRNILSSSSLFATVGNTSMRERKWYFLACLSDDNYTVTLQLQTETLLFCYKCIACLTVTSVTRLHFCNKYNKYLRSVTV